MAPLSPEAQARLIALVREHDLPHQPMSRVLGVSPRTMLRWLTGALRMPPTLVPVIEAVIAFRIAAENARSPGEGSGPAGG